MVAKPVMPMVLVFFMKIYSISTTCVLKSASTREMLIKEFLDVVLVEDRFSFRYIGVHTAIFIELLSSFFMFIDTS